MAHELEKDPVTGEIPMFFYGETPWHGLGKTLTEDRPAMAKEAIQLAGLGWEARKYPMKVTIGGKDYPVPGTFAMMRQDTIDAEGVDPVFLTTDGKALSDQYVPLQNVEAFSFFDSVVGEGKALYHTAGALRQGDRIWVLAKLPESMSILGMDDIEPYLLLTNSHDGTSSIQVMLTLVRVVCANTLRWAMGQGMREVRIRHTASAKDKLREASRLMGIAVAEVKEAEEVFTDMARVQLNKNKLEKYFSDIYAAPEPAADGKVPERTANNYEKRMKTLTRIFECGPGTDGEATCGTLFGAFNAVTDYVDHYGRGQDRSTRMESILMGHGAGIKQRAFNIATEDYLKG